MTKHFTLGQLFGLGKALGLSADDTKQAAYTLVGKDSLKKFTQRELDDVCWELIARKDSSKRRPDRATDRQIYRIAELERTLGWDKEPERLRGFLQKFYHVQSVAWLTPYNAGKLIESLKAMAAKAVTQ